MAKSKKKEERRIHDLDMRYDLVLSNMTLGVVEDGRDGDSFNLEFILRKHFNRGVTTFGVQVMDRYAEQMCWDADVADLRQVAKWFGDAAQLLELQVMELKKSESQRRKR
jgi:hypothetical protein